MIVHVLRKPLTGTVAQNALQHGCGALNIDECRIGTNGEKLSCSMADPYHGTDGSQRTWNPTSTRGIEREQHSAGRWPANLVHDGSDEVVETFPQTKSGALHANQYNQQSGKKSPFFRYTGDVTNKGYAPDSGSAARFFQQVTIK